MRREALADLTGFCAWERGEESLGIGGMIGHESEGPMAGHVMACVRIQLGLLGVVGPAWVHE